MFLMPLILAASALAAIPVVIHLFRRQQVTPIAWGAMQFLLETPLKARRRRRIDNLLLMLLRMAILLTIVLLLARPTVQSSTLISSTALDVAVVIDHSLTMSKRADNAATPGGQSGTHYDTALANTQKIARMLPPSATLSIVLAEHSPTLITSTPIRADFTDGSPDAAPRGDLARALSLLRQQKPSMTRANIPSAVAAARDLVSHGYNSRKIILILSDDQRTNWQPGAEAPWKLAAGNGGGADDRAGGITLYDFPVAPPQSTSKAPNISVRSISVTPSFLGVHRRSTVQATITNDGNTDSTNLPLQLYLDGRQVGSQTLGILPAGQSQTVRFDAWFPEPGSHWVRVKADIVDALDADNAATAAVDVSPKLPVLIVDGQLLPSSGGLPFPQAAFLQAAIESVDPATEPVPFIETRIISVSQLSNAPTTFSTYPIIILNDIPRLPKNLLDNLIEHTLAGNGLWIILGPRTDPAFLTALGKSPLASFTTTAAPAQATTTQPATQPTTPTIATDIREPNHPILQLWNAIDQHNPLGGVTLRAWWPLTPESPQLHPIVATTSGDPLILDTDVGKTGGRLILWTSPAGNDAWNNLHLVPNFTPLINETLFYLASGQNSGQPRQLDTGTPLLWTGPASHPIESATLITPNGTRRTLQPQLRGDTYLVGDRDTYEPGLYELRFSSPPTTGASPPPAAFYSVNIDPQELDPTALSAEDFQWFKSQGYLRAALNPETLPVALGAQPGGVEIWWLLGLVLFALLLTEVLVTRHLARKQGTPVLEDAGLVPTTPPALAESAGAR